MNKPKTNPLSKIMTTNYDWTKIDIRTRYDKEYNMYRVDVKLKTRKKYE